MAWKGVITNAGNELLAKWSAGETLRITRAEAGTGRVDEVSLMAQTNLMQKMLQVSILGNESLESGQRLKLRITSHTVGYKLNQIGIWAAMGDGEEKMIALYQTSDDAGVDIPGGENTTDFAYTFFALLEFSNEEGVIAVTVDPTALVTREDMENLSAKDVGADPAGSAAAVQESINRHTSNKSNPHGVTKSQVGLGNVDNTADSAKPVSTAQATAIADAKSAGTTAQSNLNTHTGNKSNPHGVSKSQVGLGNVPNVATNDQTPTYSQASSLANLVSGEKLSVSLGKIMKAIADLITHLANKSNPHEVTAAQVGAVPTSRKVNNKALSDDVSLTAADVGARASTWTPAITDVQGYLEWFGAGTKIPNNADLDTYTTNGKYTCQTEATAGTLLNCPTKTNFVMFIFDRTTSGMATQWIVTLSCEMYLRSKSSNGWRNWARFVRETDITKDMLPGVEYATLERSAGAVVYAKKVSYEFTDELGDPEGKSTIEYSIPHGISNFAEIVRWTASDGAYTYPYVSGAGGIITVKTVDGYSINLRCYKTNQEVPRTVNFNLYYTKKG